METLQVVHSQIPVRICNHKQAMARSSHKMYRLVVSIPSYLQRLYLKRLGFPTLLSLQCHNRTGSINSHLKVISNLTPYSPNQPAFLQCNHFNLRPLDSLNLCNHSPLDLDKRMVSDRATYHLYLQFHNQTYPLGSCRNRPAQHLILNLV